MLTENKRVMEMDQLNPIQMPNFVELAVNNFMPVIQGDIEHVKFMPNQHMCRIKTIDLTFFFNVHNTIRGDWLKYVIDKA